VSAVPATELDRIRAAYRERDARATGRATTPAGLNHLHELEHQVLTALLAAGKPPAGSALLDLGTGGGTLLHRLAELGAPDPKGVELSPERVARAHARYPGLDVRCASATELPFEAASFDVVTQFTVLSSVLDPVTRREIAAEVRRVLRPGGILMSYDVRPSPRPLRLARRVVGGAPADAGTPIAPLTRADLETLFGPAERVRTVQLNLDLAELVGGRRPVVAALRLLPPLRSHLLATFRRP
jgi:SAM-dependent methyltransferase